MKTFKDEIEAYLAWKSLKAYQLCAKAGVSYTSLYRYLRGDRDLMLSTVEKLKAVME